MSDRLPELRRQRALIQQHLEWLDREIAAAQSGPEPTPPASTVAPAATPTPRPTPTPISTDLPATEFAAQPDPASAARQAKQGCFLYLIVALVIFFATIFAIFHFAYGDRPWLFMDRGGSSQS